MPEPIHTSNARLDPRSQWVSIFSLRLTGYVLLALSALDVVAIVFPPDIFNPQWEFETLGRLVERVPVPLIGLALIFYGGLRYRRSLERFFLRPLALMAVLVGICYLLLVPLGIADSIRLQHASQAQYSLEQDQQRSRYRQLEQQITDAPQDKVISLARRWQLVSVQEGQGTPESARSKALAQLKKNQLSQQEQRLVRRNANQERHLKNSVKWILGAFLASVCHVYLGVGANKLFRLDL